MKISLLVFLGENERKMKPFTYWKCNFPKNLYGVSWSVGWSVVIISQKGCYTSNVPVGALVLLLSIFLLLLKMTQINYPSLQAKPILRPLDIGRIAAKKRGKCRIWVFPSFPFISIKVLQNMYEYNNQQYHCYLLQLVTV